MPFPVCWLALYIPKRESSVTRCDETVMVRANPARSDPGEIVLDAAFPPGSGFCTLVVPRNLWFASSLHPHARPALVLPLLLLLPLCLLLPHVPGQLVRNVSDVVPNPVRDLCNLLQR